MTAAPLKPGSAPVPLPSTASLWRSALPGPSRAFRTLRHWHRPLAWFTASMVAWGLVALVGYFADPRLLAADHIWAKPLKFTISLALYSATLAWMISMIDRPLLRRVAWWAGTLGALSSLLEIGVITLQVVRGTSSHFNVSTPFDATMYLLMGSGVVFLYSSALVIGVLLQVSSRIRDRSLVWALRLGLGVGVGGISVGFLMVIPTAAQRADPHLGRIGSHSVGADDPTGGLYFLGWNTEHGDLRVPHFIGMHALQLLPLLALALHALFAARLAEGTRLRIVVLGAAAYASVTALTLWQALRGQSVVHPDATTLASAGALVLIGAVDAAALVRRVHRDLAGPAATLRPAPLLAALLAPPRSASRLLLPPTPPGEEPAAMTSSTSRGRSASSSRASLASPSAPTADAASSAARVHARARRARAMATVYFVLALAGLVGTWYFNLRYTGANYVADWFANSASSSAAVDIIVIGLVASVFYVRERRALPGRLPWAVLFIVVSFAVAVSFALPFFLGLRELSTARASAAAGRSLTSPSGTQQEST